jgi:hypothetical protein
MIEKFKILNIYIKRKYQMNYSKTSLKALFGKINAKKLLENKNRGDFDGNGLMVTPKTDYDSKLIEDLISSNDYYGIYDKRNNYWFFPEEPEMFDSLERELDKEFSKLNINATFESQWE